jgi:hypothetical protein
MTVDFLLSDRVLSKIRVEGDCWKWTAGKNNKGYGYVRMPGKEKRSVHKLFYETLRGPVPEGLQIDHLCRVRNCVNPDHMEAVMPRENQRRGRRNQYRNVTHCIHGHEFTLENTYRWSKRPNERGCRMCIRERSRQHSMRKEGY